MTEITLPANAPVDCPSCGKVIDKEHPLQDATQDQGGSAMEVVLRRVLDSRPFCPHCGARYDKVHMAGLGTATFGNSL